MILEDSTSLVDIHSHLVPGVDDGARHVPGVLAAIERMTHIGIRRLITTPHIQGSLTLVPDRLEQRRLRPGLAGAVEAGEAHADDAVDDGVGWLGRDVGAA